MIINNFGGVRLDGTNATIVGKDTGEFISDRNNIVRVWMDHGIWPMLTLALYIEQTGDLDIILEKQKYYQDRIIHRGEKIDKNWNENQRTVQ